MIQWEHWQEESFNKVWLNKTRPGSEAPTCNLSPWEVKAVETEVQGWGDPVAENSKFLHWKKWGKCYFVSLLQSLTFSRKQLVSWKLPEDYLLCMHTSFIQSLAPHKLKFNIVPSSCLSRFWIGMGRLAGRFVGLGQSVSVWHGSSL